MPILFIFQSRFLTSISASIGNRQLEHLHHSLSSWIFLAAATYAFEKYAWTRMHCEINAWLGGGCKLTAKYTWNAFIFIHCASDWELKRTDSVIISSVYYDISIQYYSLYSPMEIDFIYRRPPWQGWWGVNWEIEEGIVLGEWRLTGNHVERFFFKHWDC